MSDSPHHSGGYQQDDPEHVGGYEPSPPEPPDDPPRTTVEPLEETGEPADGPVAAERFRRTTPARRKPIPARRSGGYWRLAFGTVAYVMVVGGMADYVDPQTRALGHLAFWALIGLAMFVSVSRERRHGWEPAPRWPWPAGALGGAVAVEILVVAVGSPAVIVGSLILLGLALFVLLLFG
ncbi:hypothetical protein KIK06_18655 [Nocardiopsis sp. EMB25]|uniref:hypothetical protein n=1 Tax=Nocardiopsis sp. EMB25 TaxID=2835867 RepID=UPI002283B1C7|nr:hypothetical protein [Nocardiopsis sp. EMB25]MCY9785915.1 hypothetical protein [Nocardiopsis sp. EMB25]